VGSRIYKIYTDGPDAVSIFGGDLYKIYSFYTKRVPLAYKRPVVDGLKSVFSGFKKLYGIITD
jgi:hypothetical protein